MVVRKSDPVRHLISSCLSASHQPSDDGARLDSKVPVGIHLIDDVQACTDKASQPRDSTSYSRKSCGGQARLMPGSFVESLWQSFRFAARRGHGKTRRGQKVQRGQNFKFNFLTMLSFWRASGRAFGKAFGRVSDSVLARAVFN